MLTLDIPSIFIFYFIEAVVFGFGGLFAWLVHDETDTEGRIVCSIISSVFFIMGIVIALNVAGIIDVKVVG